MLRIAWRNFICLVFGVCFFLSNQAEEVEWKSGRVFTSEQVFGVDDFQQNIGQNNANQSRKSWYFIGFLIWKSCSYYFYIYIRTYICVFNCVYLYHACSEGLTQRPSYADEILESDCFGTWEEVCAIVAIFGISGCKLFSLEKRWP